MNIEQLKAQRIVGNAYSDRNIFTTVDVFVHDTSNTINDRAEALRWMSDKVMGCGRDEHITDADIVHDYLVNC